MHTVLKYYFTHQNQLVYVHFLFTVQDPKNPQFNQPENYDIDKVVNFYITTVDLDNKTLLSIGAWMILHDQEPFSDLQHNIQTAADILKKTQKPILFMLHGVACNRIKAIQPYKQLRKHFLVISVDHRGK